VDSNLGLELVNLVSLNTGTIHHFTNPKGKIFSRIRKMTNPKLSLNIMSNISNGTEFTNSNPNHNKNTNKKIFPKKVCLEFMKFHKSYRRQEKKTSKMPEKMDVEHSMNQSKYNLFDFK
jgi:hypothetical protein